MFATTLAVVAAVGVAALMFNGLELVGVRLRWITVGALFVCAVATRRWTLSLGPGDRRAWTAHESTVIEPEPMPQDLTGRYTIIPLRSTPREIVRRQAPDFTTIVVDPTCISIPGWAFVPPLRPGTRRHTTVQIAWTDIAEWHVVDAVDGPQIHRIVMTDGTSPAVDRGAVADNVALLDAVRTFGRKAIVLHTDLEHDTDR